MEKREHMLKGKEDYDVGAEADEQEPVEGHHSAHTVRHTLHAAHGGRVSSEQPKRSTAFLVMAVVLGILIVIATVQAVELVSIKNKLSEGVPSAGATAPSAASAEKLSNSLENLPSMVGGC